jgi:hypothetical protein
MAGMVTGDVTNQLILPTPVELSQELSDAGYLLELSYTWVLTSK